MHATSSRTQPHEALTNILQKLSRTDQSSSPSTHSVLRFSSFQNHNQLEQYFQCNSMETEGHIQNSSLVGLEFHRALRRDPARRTPYDIQTLYFTLRSFDCLSRCEDEHLLGIAHCASFLQRSANDILYCRGEIASSWYILISGSVFIDGSMFLPITSFGRRGAGQTRRPNECLILEPSEMVCIDYVDSSYSPPLRYSLGPQSNRNSHSSDTSSAYSGSDTMGSVPGSDDMDLSGLVESAVDSDEEDDLADSMDSLTVRDAVRECLEKDPTERTEHDVQVLLEFTQHLAAFNNLTMTVRKALCQAMVFAVVEKAGTTVLNDGEELDSWSVVVHGSVEVLQQENSFVLSAGDSFGLPPTLDKQYFKGEMRTRVDDCQFVCVTQQDYFRILKQGQDSQTRHTKNNKTVLVTELKNLEGGRKGQIVIRGTVDELMNQLVLMENPSVDPTYVEDFLLTQRVFSNSLLLTEKLSLWFNDPAIKDRVTRVVLLWVNNHFIDFETDTELMAFLQKFQGFLENTKDMSGQLRLLQIACSAKSRPRTVQLTRPSRDDPLPFNIMGGADNGYGIYISQVDGGSRAEELGVRRGDELVEVNGQSFRSISLSKAFDVLRGSTHLVLTVKCNFLGYHECVHSSIPLVPRPSTVGNNTTHVTNLKQHKNLSRKERLIKALMGIHFLPKTNITDKITTDETDILIDGNDPCKIDFPENVLKIYRPDQTFKYFLVNKETSAREVVMLALQEFVDLQNHNSRDYALFQVSVTSGILKQGRLPDQLDSLAERIPLGARYYIKRSDSTEPLVPDDLFPEITKECEVGFLHLNPVELALQLTLEDYAIFRQIEMTEFIDDLFSLKSKYGTPNLNAFAQLVNRETFWVVTEVTKETVLPRRVQILKRFIKVATQCRECRNFNSMFAIVSGLGHCSVARLRNTWDKLPTKHQRLFNEMQELMDPSRNMGKYRSLLAQTAGQTPMIPFYPVVRKDLTFIDLGNSSQMESLVNFEKMRMVSKEIRQLVQMSAAPFDTSSQPTMAAMNQLSNTGTQLTTTTGKRRKKSQGPPNAKKMFEEMNMIRKVKAYLSKLQVISDESLLHTMSLNCEPAGETVKKVNPQPRRHPSPTLSTSSSASSESNRRKFGAGSPGSYQKLMALSEPKTKIHQHNFRSSPTMQRKHSHHERSNSESSSTSSRLLLSVESSSVLPGK